jgi:hypothetical protein
MEETRSVEKTRRPRRLRIIMIAWNNGEENHTTPIHHVMGRFEEARSGRINNTKTQIFTFELLLS